MSAEEHVFDLLPSYALDCLNEDETILVSEHLAVCADCRAELPAYQFTVDQLALAQPETAPPPELKTRLMERIQPAPSTDQARLSWRDAFAVFLRRAAPAWGAAGLLLLLVLGVSNIWLWQRINQQEESQSDIMRTVALSGTAVVPDASGLIVISLDGEHGTLVVDGLPPLDRSHQYQLWLIDDGQRQSGGVFSVDQEGYGALWVSSPEPLSDYSAVGITIEPAGGSPGPTGDKVMGGSL
jgi:anti-sigma-K factor RskA